MKHNQQIQCDIVLPIYNGFSYVRDCIESIRQYTPSEGIHLYLIDDFSDTFTNRYLQDQAAQHPQITFHRNKKNFGFRKSGNIGISLGTAPYIVLINSDVIVTPRWLERLIACIESAPNIAVVNPLTNQASPVNVPIAPGANFFGMDWYLEKYSSRCFPDLVTDVSFCTLLRRKALEEVGVLDESAEHGYGEASNLCMRLTTHGYRMVIADHVYVYHKGRRGSANQSERYLHNHQRFNAYWVKEPRRQLRAFRKTDPLKPMRKMFALHQRWDPRPTVWQTGRSMLSCWWEKDLVGTGRAAVRGLLQLSKARRGVPTPASVAKVTRPNRLRVTYVLHDLAVAGGILSVIQLVNELVLLGVEARIVALYEDSAIYDWTKLLTCPVIFRNPRELIANFPESDIVVATLWITAPWINKLISKGRAHTGVYFIQDYEPWFFPEEDQAARERVRATYPLIDNKIVKSDWLQSMLAADGFTAHKIPLGMDLAKFYPRDVQSFRPTILAMARPQTPRRGFPFIIAALARVKQVMPDMEIILFGNRFLSFQDIPFPYRNEGTITDQNRLAELYSEADVFLDGSDFQGFGRCALEAMACGAACVLTGLGGVTEYANDGENALVVMPKKPDMFAQAIIEILKNPQLKQKLVKGGFATVKNYCHKREARETLKYFQEIISN